MHQGALISGEGLHTFILIFMRAERVYKSVRLNRQCNNSRTKVTAYEDLSTSSKWPMKIV